MELSIRIAGAAGQGMATTSEMLGRAITRAGLFAFARNDAESRIRGGLSFSHLRCSERELAGITDHIDLLVAQTREAAESFADLLSPDGLVICQADWGLEGAAPFFLRDLAVEAGSDKAAGTVALAALAGLLGLDGGLIETVIRERFAGNDELTAINLKAADLGRVAIEEWGATGRFALPKGEPNGRMWLSGAQAVALGAVAGGATFVAGYPMSPATGVLVNLAAWSKRAGIVVEQAEDEVAAINMVAGAAYAGARAMTATSGGGFCLMTEGVSLLGMIETPAVIVLAQRPGPATGLPTRLAQGDLNLVRHAGHGFFPRIVLAPKNIRDCFEVTAQAFDLAERYQTPVFVMTDQLLHDSQATIEPPSIEGLPSERHFLTPAELAELDVYRRFALTEDGISPLAAPGVSRHLVVVDSDEHDQDGYLTERAEEAEKMALKRRSKALAVAENAWPPELTGPLNGGPVVVSWGSTFETAAEAVGRLAETGREAAHVNLTWLWPPPEEELAALLKNASPLIVVEASVGGELASLIREVCLREVDVIITKLDGRPFTVDGLLARLVEEI